MGRVIVYAMGQLFHKKQDRISWKDVVAIADGKVREESSFRNLPVIGPDQIREYEYDYIAVFSDGIFEEIKCFLIGYHFIPEERIISWRALVPGNEPPQWKLARYYRTILQEFRFHKILDLGMSLFLPHFFSTEEFLPGYDIQLDGIGERQFPLEKNLYKNVFSIPGESENGYDAALLWGTLKKIEEEIHSLQGRAGHVLYHAPYALDGENEIRKIDDFFRKYPVKKRISMPDVVFWLIRLSPEQAREDIGIYVVTHKNYQVKQDDMYRPICVGKSYRDSRFLLEDEGENIAGLNEKINECTALYWIWKNTDTRYVGLNHYRRYFYNNGIRNSGNYLDSETVQGYLQEYDIILAIAGPLYDMTVQEQVGQLLDRHVCLEAMGLVRDAMHRHQPEYVDVFDSVIRGHKFHMCQMFVTRREILNAYCEWLFSFLIEAAENFDASSCEGTDKRAVGFWAERLLTTWLLKQDLKIKELPYTMVKD